MENFKLDPTLKTKWLKALRSGRYKQCRMALKDGDAYCCLGVLCNIQDRHWNKTGNGIYHKLKHPDYHYTNFSILPQSVQEKLSMMNDKEELNFSQIADWIEANL